MYVCNVIPDFTMTKTTPLSHPMKKFLCFSRWPQGHVACVAIAKCRRQNHTQEAPPNPLWVCMCQDLQFIFDSEVVRKKGLYQQLNAREILICNQDTGNACNVQYQKDMKVHFVFKFPGNTEHVQKCVDILKMSISTLPMREA